MSIDCRYQVTSSMGHGHLILGKLSNSTALTSEEIASIQLAFPGANLDQGTVYHRMMIDGVLYTSTNYQRHTTTNDYVLCFSKANEKHFGFARKYFSMCNTTCTCSSPCIHIVIVDSLKVRPCRFVMDTVAGATARHIHSIDYSR